MATYAIYIASFLSYYYFFPQILLGSIYAWFSDISQSVVVLMMTLPTLSMGMLSLVMSTFLGKANKKLMLLIGLVLIIAGGGIILANQGASFGISLVAAVLPAFGYTIIINTASVALVELNPDDGPGVIGVNNAVGCVGMMILSKVGGMMAADGNWVRPYWLTLLVVLPVIAVIFLYPSELAAPAKTAQAGGAQKPKAAISGENVKRFLMIAIPFFLYTLGITAWNNNLSDYIINVRQIGTAAQAGNASSLSSFAGLLGGFFMVRLISKTLKTKTVPICLLLIGASFLTMALNTDQIMLLYLTSFLFMVFFQPVTSMNFASVGKAMAAGAAVPLLRTIQSFTNFLGPYIMTALAAPFGGSIPVKAMIGIIMIVIAALCYFVVYKKEATW